MKRLFQFALLLAALLIGAWTLGASWTPRCQVDGCDRRGDSRVYVIGGFSYLEKKTVLGLNVWVCHEHYAELIAE